MGRQAILPEFLVYAFLMSCSYFPFNLLCDLNFLLCTWFCPFQTTLKILSILSSKILSICLIAYDTNKDVTMEKVLWSADFVVKNSFVSLY